MFRVAVACLPLLAACDRLLLPDKQFLDASPTTCVRDPFDPPLSNLWDVRPPTGDMARLENGQLVVPYDTTRTDVVEVRSNELIDFRGGTAQITNIVAQPTPAFLASTFFGFGVDEKNAYLFGVFSRDGTMLEISFAIRENGIDTNNVIPFNQATFKFWRFVHVSETNMLEFHTSETGDADNFAKRFETPARVPVDAIRFSIGTARTFAGGMTSAPAVYDDFELCYPTRS